MFCLRSSVREVSSLKALLKVTPPTAASVLRTSKPLSGSIDTKFWRGNGEMGVPSLHGDMPKPAFRDEDRKGNWRSQTDAIDRNAVQNVKNLVLFCN